MEITHFPEPVGEDFDLEEFAGRDEQLAETLLAAEQDHFAELDRKIRILTQTIDYFSSMEGYDWVKKVSEKTDNSFPVYAVFAHYIPWKLDEEIRQTLQDAEQDRDYEEWMNSKEYQKSLKNYNLHKLLAWEKFSDDNRPARQHPKWSGQETESDEEINGTHYYVRDALLKERYKVEVYVDTLCWGKNYYAIGRTPYGDVYIPNKIAEWLKDFCGLYEMEIALQDVKGASGKGPNSFRWTCVYLHNNGHSLE